MHEGLAGHVGILLTSHNRGKKNHIPSYIIFQSIAMTLCGAIARRSTRERKNLSMSHFSLDKPQYLVGY
jgi:hypothetical protein